MKLLLVSAIALLFGAHVLAAGDRPASAITGVRVTCDRWPDARDLRQFGLDACRLENAKTDTDKALAVWRWIRHLSTSTNGHIPEEPGPDGRTVKIHDDAIKILNVYAAHWCDGLSRVYELVWRAMGHRATKCFFNGHTVVLAEWRDDDGQTRWHTLDTSEGWFAYTRDGSRIVSPDDLMWDFSLYQWPSRTPRNHIDWDFAYWGWVACPHATTPAPLADISVSPGGLHVSAWGQPYSEKRPPNLWVDNFGGLKGLTSFEHGPYVIHAGSSEDRFLLTPADGTPADGGGLVFHRTFPAVVADSQWFLRFRRAAEKDTFRLSLSIDGGNSWKLLHQSEAVGPARDGTTAVNLCPQDTVSLRGRYEAWVKLETTPGTRVDSVVWTAQLQDNIFALPTLMPGTNRIHVAADIPAGRALKMTCEWLDAAGRAQRNVTRVNKAPADYTIVCAGRRWEDVTCTKLTYENVPAEGERAVTVLEHTGPAANDGPFDAAFATVDIISRDCPPKEMAPAADYIGQLSDRKERYNALAALRVLGAETAAPAVRDLVLNETKDMRLRTYAIQTLWALDPAICRPVALAVVKGSPEIRYDVPDDKPAAVQDKESFRGFSAMVVARLGLREAIPLMEPGWRTTKGLAGRWAYIRALGIFGGKEAVGPLVEIMNAAVNAGDPDSMELAAVALGGIGDPAAAEALLAALDRGGDYPRPYVLAALAACGVKSAAPPIRRHLASRDEAIRQAAFEALIRLNDAAARPVMERAAAKEPIDWLKSAMAEKLAAWKDN
ncbi:MAG: hypothetical protein BIFFINMI_00782 [Phycisphaerae bacterium]|nr:hypothetical protein [Phycisphaerae bacterium]